MNKNFRAPAASGALTLEDVVAEAARTVEGFEADLAVVQNDIASMRAMQGVAGITAPTGSANVERIGAFFKQLVARKLGLDGVIEKLADNLTIDAADRGGYLVPATVAPQVDALIRAYGDVLGACKFTVAEPGRLHRIPFYSSAPTAAWQENEGDPLTEADVQIGGLERRPLACGNWVDVSHQLWWQSAHDVGDTLSREIFAAVAECVETALIAGEEGVTAPHDGLLQVAGAHDQNPLATATTALLSKFVGESLDDQPVLWKRGTLLLSPTVIETLLGNDVVSNYTPRLTIADNGLMRFGKFPVLASPAVGLNAILADLNHVHVVRSEYTVLVDDRSQIKNLLVTLAALGWFSYGISYPAAVSRAAITALS